MQGNIIAICLEQLIDQFQLLRQWLALCLAKVNLHFMIIVVIRFCYSLRHGRRSIVGQSLHCGLFSLELSAKRKVSAPSLV